MKLSIVTISYNQVRFLKDCIRSVRNSKLEDYEHIIVDAGSSDGSRELIEAETTDDSRLVKIFEPDSGPADGLNKGLARARGDYFAYINSDDVLAPEGLRQLLYTISSERADVVVGHGWQIDESGRPVKFLKSDVFTPNRYALGVGVVVQQATLIRRSFLESHGIKFNVQNAVSWDIELIFDCWEAGAKFVYADSIAGYFRIYDATISGSGNYRHKLLVQRRILEQRSSLANFRFAMILIRPFARIAKRIGKEAYIRKHKPTFISWDS